MRNEQLVDQFLNDLINNGAKPNIIKLKKYRKKMINLLNKSNDKDPISIVEMLSDEILEKMELLLNYNDNGLKVFHALSIGLFLGNDKYKLKLVGGRESREDNGKEITVNTLFDIASITKLILLILVFVCIDKGYFSLNDKISKLYLDLDEEEERFRDFTIRDILLMLGELRTDGNIRYAKNKEEALKILSTIHLVSSDRTKNKYNDFGPIILGRIIEKVISKKIGIEQTLDQIIDNLILKPMSIDGIKFDPNINIDSITGNGNSLGLVNDPKSRILGGNIGSAGIFSNSDGMGAIAQCIGVLGPTYKKSLIDREILKKFGQHTFPNSNKGLLGLYQKMEDGLNSSFVPNECGYNSFASQGWTGSVAVFDPKNLMHFNILVGSVMSDDEKNKYYDICKNDKSMKYGMLMNELIDEIITKVVYMMCIKQYFDQFNEINTVDKNYALKMRR